MAETNDIFVPILNIKDNPCNPRQNKLRKFFYDEYGFKPDCFVNVPGRVNIIGEHVDYCGYPVLPMAIEQSILLAVSKNDNGILQLRNEIKNYPNFKTDLNSIEIKVPIHGKPEWYSYFLCGVKGILEYIGFHHIKHGMTIALNGNIPPASGLSSSSALVCSAVLVTAFILDVPLNCHTLAMIAAKCEHYIGTQGGGMDQAIAFLAKSGCVQLIEFYPALKAQSIKLPNCSYFVVANSLTEMNKAATSDYNQRVVECRIACRFLAKKLNINNWKDTIQFIVLQNKLDCNLEDMENYTKKILCNELYSKEDIMKELDITKDQFENEFLTENTKDMEYFKLRQRTLHVIQESLRVQKFCSICEENNGNSIEKLSELITQSHESLRHLYECSYPNLDELIRISNEIGIAARLTGAGWGGCIVALCDSMEKCEEYIKEIKAKYYKNLSKLKEYDLNNVIFATSPHGGASIILLEK